MTFRRLWAPWRAGYVSGARKPEEPKGCLFCRVGRSRGKAREDRVLAHGAHAFSLLNKFPYNNGHLMVAPYRHVARLGELREEEWLDIWRLADDAIGRLEKSFKPHGFNLGVNLGRPAGAGIPGHLHLHIVPRWTGDTNFMPVTAHAKVISQSLEAAYRALKKARPSPKRPLALPGSRHSRRPPTLRRVPGLGS